MQHRALVAHEQAQQLDEAGAIESAGGAIGSRLDRDRIAHAGDRQSLLAAQLGAEHGARCAARRTVAEQPRRRAGGEARDAGHPPHGAPRGAAARIGEHEVRVRAPAHQP